MNRPFAGRAFFGRADLSRSTIFRRLAAVVLAAAALSASAPAAARADDADEAYDRGLDALEAGDHARAIAELSKAIQLDPQFAEAWMARGYAHAALGRFERAVADYDQALRLDPEDAETWCNRGLARSKLGQRDEAVADLGEAIRLDPKLVPAYHVRAWVHAEREEYAKAAADYTAALRLGGDNPALRFGRALCYSALKQYAQAVEDLNVAIRARPGDLRYYGARGAAYVYLGRHGPGDADLRKAIEMNPRDAGRAYEPWKKKELDAESLAHGRRQVERMLADRPRMAQYAGPAGFLKQWAARKFAGEDLGVTIDWDPAAPTHSEAEHVVPGPGRRGRIRVAEVHLWGGKRGQPRTFEQLWSNAVFELHNIAYGPKFVQLHEQAAAGTISKEQFVEGIWNHEHLAAQETRAFYVQVYLPWVEKNKLTSDPALWFAAIWDDAERTFSGFTDRAEYPWRPYARQYDWAAVRRLFQQGKPQEAAPLLEAMAAEAEYPHDAPRVWTMLGRCRLEMGQAAEAVAALSRAVELDPDQAEAYRHRADAHRRLGETQKAAADDARARQLQR
jgi:tetratricopeptide (TPR) repeat protein